MIQLILPQHSNGGVYDFACSLQSEIGQNDVRIVYLSEENAASWEIGKSDTIILQMSGYGFSKRGVPLWLLHELDKRRSDIKILGIFSRLHLRDGKEGYLKDIPLTLKYVLEVGSKYPELSDFVKLLKSV